MALGYNGETKAWGQDMAAPIVAALRGGRWVYSHTAAVWGQRAAICVPLQNELFVLAAGLGVFAHRPGYNADCTQATPVAPNGSSSGQSLGTAA